MPMLTARIWALGMLAGAAVLAASCGTVDVAGTGTSSGSGGAAGCSDSSDCPPTPPCVLATCTAHVCGSVNAPPGTLGQPDTPADCHAAACDGEGHATSTIVDDANVPTPPSPCLVGTCTNGVAGAAPAPAGTACGQTGLTCDGAGTCDRCISSAACSSPLVCGAGGTCVAPSCSDGIQDGQETGVDCGGGAPMDCPPCSVGEGCVVDTDCSTGSCCSNVCADVTSDADNCGSCGNSCKGATCLDGACEVGPLVSGQDGPYAVAVNAVNVYWTNRTGGTVMACAISGCNDAPTVLASGQLSPGGIAADGSRVYWTNAGTSAASMDGTVMACAAGGCNGGPTVLASGQAAPDGIAVFAGTVYWTDGGEEGVTGAGSVMQCAAAGCKLQPTALAPAQTSPSGIAANATGVYWVGGFPSNTVQACALGGCNNQPTQLGMGPGVPGSQGLALDATTVFWGGIGPILKCAVSGCNGQGSVVSPMPGPPTTSLATNGVSVYWTGIGAAAVVKCPVGGCAQSQPTTVIAGPGGAELQAYALAVDATHVYWANMSAGTIVEAPK